MTTQTQTTRAIWAQFIPAAQLRTLRSLIRGEEGAHYRERLTELADIFRTMPQTYEQDGRGDRAIVYLHYFYGGMDWYITEKDANQDGEGQQQAFGLVNLGYGAELGYINLAELCAQPRIELDLYWTPRPLADVRSNAWPNPM